MKKITYQGYTISQLNNNHIVIVKNGEWVFHANATKKLSEDELKKQIDWFIKIREVI